MSKDSLSIAYAMKKRNKPKYAEGGEVGEVEAPQGLDTAQDSSSENEDIVDAIMAKRRMAKGGLVLPAGETDDHFEAPDRFSQHGKEDDLEETSNDEMSNESDDQHLISQILRDRKSKRG